MSHAAPARFPLPVPRSGPFRRRPCRRLLLLACTRSTSVRVVAFPHRTRHVPPMGVGGCTPRCTFPTRTPSRSCPSPPPPRTLPSIHPPHPITAGTLVHLKNPVCTLCPDPCPPPLSLATYRAIWLPLRLSSVRLTQRSQGPSMRDRPGGGVCEQGGGWATHRAGEYGRNNQQKRARAGPTCWRRGNGKRPWASRLLELKRAGVGTRETRGHRAGVGCVAVRRSGGLTRMVLCAVTRTLR